MSIDKSVGPPSLSICNRTVSFPSVYALPSRPLAWKTWSTWHLRSQLFKGRKPLKLPYTSVICTSREADYTVITLRLPSSIHFNFITLGRSALTYPSSSSSLPELILVLSYIGRTLLKRFQQRCSTAGAAGSTCLPCLSKRATKVFNTSMRRLMSGFAVCSNLSNRHVRKLLWLSVSASCLLFCLFVG